MKQYNTIIFDLDGTLADTSEGICNCYRHAMERLRLPAPRRELLKSAIGAPLFEMFRQRFALDEETARSAVEIYRERYREKGIYEVRVYDGIRELLSYLKQNGYQTAVATLKYEPFAKTMLAKLNLDQYFDIILGIDQGDHLTKKQIVMRCLEALRCTPDDAVLVGDSSYDGVGAGESGVGLIAVTYGFGFGSEEDALPYHPVFIAENPADIVCFMRQKRKSSSRD